MDGAARAFAAPTTLKLGGKEWQVNARLARHYGEAVQYILAKRPDPHEEFRKSAHLYADDPALLALMVKATVEQATTAARNMVTQAEIDMFFDTSEGTAFSFWMAIRQKSPDGEWTPTLEEVMGMLTDEADKLAEAMTELEADMIVKAKVDQAVSQASGEDLRGNSTGLPAEAEGRPEDRSPGDDSAGT